MPAGRSAATSPAPLAIHVEHQHTDGTRHITAFDRALARLIAHEIDHLEGTLYTDHLPPTPPASTPSPSPNTAAPAKPGAIDSALRKINSLHHSLASRRDPKASARHNDRLGIVSHGYGARNSER